MTIALAILFFISGAAGLIFEALWFRQAGLALGNSVWASTIVLSSFMGGIAAGNALAARFGGRLGRPLAAYALAEAVVAVSGIAITLGLPQLGRMLAPMLGEWSDVPALLDAARLVLSFSGLMFPAIAMGFTLPLLTRALRGRVSSFGESLGLLYGFNTVGAALGALVAEGWLIGSYGVRGSALLAGGLAGAAGLLALVAERRWELTADTPLQLGAPNKTPTSLLAAAFGCGFCLLALEVIWVRFLALFVPSSALIFAVVLAVVLTAIGSGSLFASLWMARDSRATRLLPTLAWLAGLACVLSYGFFDSTAEIERWLAWGISSEANLGITALLAVRLCLPVAALSGLIFAVQGAALHQALGGGEARSTGLLTLANTLGGLCGAAVSGLIALPLVGLEHSLFLVGALYALAGALMLNQVTWRGAPAVLTISSAVALTAALLLFPFGSLTERFLSAGLGAHFERDQEKLIELRESRDATLRLLRRDFLGEPLYFRLLTDGMSMTGNDWQARRYMNLFVTLPAALHPELRSALVIGHGIGSTTRALTRQSTLEEIVVVDPSRATLELASQVFAEPASDPLTDPRVEVRIEDGRFYLLSTTRRFDLITGEPPPPKAPGIVSLYTREHFQLMRDRLEPGGIVSYWLPYASLNESDGKAILAAFLEVFPDMTLWYGWNLDLVMLGTSGEQRPTVSVEHFGRQWREPSLQAELLALGLEQPQQLAAAFLADAETLAEKLAGVAPLTDDRPHRLSPRIVDAESANRAIAEWLDEARAARSFQRSPWVAAQLPPEIRDDPLDAFADQNLGRFAVSEAARGLPSPKLLHEILAETQRRGPVSWLLSSDLDRQRIAARRATQAGAAYHLGVRALSERHYDQAALHLTEAAARQQHGSRLLLLAAYAHCRANRLADANELLRTARAQASFEATDWAWLVETFSLEPN